MRVISCTSIIHKFHVSINQDCATLSATLGCGAATFDGTFYSTNAGANWTNFGLQGKQMNAIASLTKSGTDYLYAARNDASNKLYKTTNTDTNWTLDNSYPGGIINKLTVSADTILYAASTDGLYKKTVSGSWQHADAGLYKNADMLDLVSDTRNSSIVYSGSRTSVFRSSDGGSQWADAASRLIPLASSAVAARGDVILGLSSTHSVIERKDQSVSTAWKSAWMGSGDIRDFTGKSAMFVSSSIGFAAGKRTIGGDVYASLWRTTNGGADWAASESSWTPWGANICNGVAVDPLFNNRLYAYGYQLALGTEEMPENTKIAYSDDTGESWYGADNYLNGYTVTDMAVDSSSHGQYYSNNVYACSYGGVFYSNNAGSDWDRILNKYMRVLGFNPEVPNVIYAAGDSTGSLYYMKKSTNSGSTWGNVAMTQKVMRIAMHPAYPRRADRLWIIASDGDSVFESTDGGSGWINRTGSLPRPVSDLRVDPSSPRFMYAATPLGVYRIDPAPDAPSGLASVSSTHPKIKWNKNTEADLKQSGTYQVWHYYVMCTWNGSVWVEGGHNDEAQIATTTDTTYTDNNKTLLAGDCPHNEVKRRDYYYVKAVDQGDNVSAAADPAVGFDISCYDQNPEKIVARPQGVKESRPIPDRFFLEPNYPNPFNPVTEIRYGLPVDVHVSVRVFDILGRDVAALVDEHQEAGYKTVRFNGEGLPSGLYFYRIDAGRYREVRKMMLSR